MEFHFNIKYHAAIKQFLQSHRGHGVNAAAQILLCKISSVSFVQEKCYTDLWMIFNLQKLNPWPLCLKTSAQFGDLFITFLWMIGRPIKSIKGSIWAFLYRRADLNCRPPRRIRIRWSMWNGFDEIPAFARLQPFLMRQSLFFCFKFFGINYFPWSVFGSPIIS